MDNIQVFPSEEFGDIRTLVIKGEPWFVGIDVAKALGYKKPTGAVTNNVDEDDTLTEGVTDSMGRLQNTLVVNESGLYSLIFNSKLESAKKFKKWVTSEVLPSIRKTGEYRQDNTGDVQGQIKLLAQGTTELYQKVDALDKKLHNELMNLPLLGVESDTIDKALKSRGVEIAGGKESNAYKDKNLLRRIYWDLHGQLRREFGVNTYKAIKRNQTDLALKFLAEYKPPMHLREQIENANAQQTFDLEGGVR